MCKQGLYAEWWDYSDLNEKGPLHSSRTKKEGQYWPLDSRQHCTCCRTAVPLLWIEGQFGLMHLILFKFRRLHIFCRFLFGKVFKVTLHGGNCRCFYRQFSVVVLGTSLVSVTYSAFQAKPSEATRLSDDRLSLLGWKRLWVPSWRLQLGLLVSFLQRTWSVSQWLRIPPCVTVNLQLAGLSGCEHKRCGFNPWVGKIPWRRAWQPTAVFLPEESHGQRSLVGCGP